MEDKQTKHYGIWSVGQHNQGVPQKDKPQSLRDKDVSALPSKLDDLQASLLLYSYGLPINVSVGAAASALPNGPSVKCKTKSISTDSVDFAYEVASDARYEKSHIGSPVKLDLDEVGTFKGTIASQDNGGFQVKVDADAKGALSSKLVDLATSRGIKHDVSIAAGPQITRLELKNKSCAFDDPNGILRTGTILNISPVDALIGTRFIPRRPAIIVFRGPMRYSAMVTDVFGIGFLVKFCTPIPERYFCDQMRFCDA